MRHHNNKRIFGRKKDVRNAFVASIAQALILREKIKTTEPRAKEIRPFVEKLITRGKTGTLASRRAVTAEVGIEAGAKIIETLSPKYKNRAGGYTRITKLIPRMSDGAKMAIIEFV